MKNLQKCLSYLSSIDFDQDTLKAARAELADVTQRASAALPPVNADATWNAALEAAAQVAATEAERIGSAPVDGGAVAWVARAISALKRGGK